MSFQPMLMPPMGERVLRWSVRQVDSRWERRRFRRYPARLYRGDRYWLPPLAPELPSAWPEDTEGALFAAETTSSVGEDLMAGRMAAWIDRSYNERHEAATGFFGLFEVVNHEEVAADLFDAVLEWLMDRLPEASTLRGPVGLAVPGACGLLTDGFNARPLALMPYSAPYYPDLLEQLDFVPVRAAHAYRLELKPPSLSEVEPKTAAAWDLAPLSTERLDTSSSDGSPVLCGVGEEVSCWLPEIAALRAPALTTLARYADPRLCFSLLQDGVPAGCIVGLPDLNGPRAAARGWPFPLNRVRSALARRHIDQALVLPAIGALGGDRRVEAAGALYARVAREAACAGYSAIEVGCVDDEEWALIEPLTAMGARRVKTYQVYEKTL